MVIYYFAVLDCMHFGDCSQYHIFGKESENVDYEYIVSNFAAKKNK